MTKQEEVDRIVGLLDPFNQFDVIDDPDLVIRDRIMMVLNEVHKVSIWKPQIRDLQKVLAQAKTPHALKIALSDRVGQLTQKSCWGLSALYADSYTGCTHVLEEAAVVGGSMFLWSQRTKLGMRIYRCQKAMNQYDRRLMLSSSKV